MMNIAFITLQIGNSAFGQVTERLVKALGNKPDVSLFVFTSSSTIQNASNIYAYKYFRLFGDRIDKILYVVLGLDLKSILWETVFFLKFYKRIKTLSIDVIYCYTSREAKPVLNIGYWFSKVLKLPYVIHFCDPIPPPAGWQKSELYRKSLKRPVRKYLKAADLISMNNERMLSFMQQEYKMDILTKSFVVPDSCVSERKFFEVQKTGKYVLSYIGVFYTLARTPTKLIYGFSKAFEQNPNIHLKIIGKNHIDLKYYNITEPCKSNIEIIRWVADVEEYIVKSDVLIDIDADIENDVFISSKLKAYLTYNRPILSITGINSPSYNHLIDIKESVIISSHDEDEIGRSILASVKKCRTAIDYSDRNTLIEQFDVSNVADNIISHFNTITHVRK